MATAAAVNLSSTPMPVLKAMLASHGCDTSGKKAELVERLKGKLVEVEIQQRASAIRTTVVSAASTSELDRVAAELRAWRANGPALVTRLGAALQGTELVLRPPGGAPSGDVAALRILDEARLLLLFT